MIFFRTPGYCVPFRTLWNYGYAGSARTFFDHWYSWASRSRLAPIIKVAKMLKRRLANVLTYFKHRITNAMVRERKLHE